MFLTELAKRWACVLLMLYSFALITGQLILPLILAIVVSILIHRKSDIQKPDLHGPFICIGLILSLIIFRISNHAILGWDPRSIWLMHTKMIYFTNGIQETSGWAHPSIPWSHADYPLLSPLVGAFLSKLSGGWNESVIKYAPIFTIFPAILWLCSFYQRSFNFFSFFAIMMVMTASYVWSGFLDGHIALYACCSVLLFSRYLEKSDDEDLISAVLALGMLVNLKNEGVLIALSVVFVVLLIKVFSKVKIIPSLRISGTVSIAFFPLVLWAYFKNAWKVISEYHFLSAETSQRVFERIRDHHSLREIAQSMFFYQRPVLKVILIIVLSLIFFKFARKQKRLGITFWLACGSAIVYACGLFLVYLATPYDLMWHLMNSVERTLLSFVLFMLIAIFSVVRSLEND